MSSIASLSAGSTSQSTSLSGGISFAGLGSGTDFQTMIDQLKKVESVPKNRLELWREDWQKKIDAFDELLDVIGKLSTKLSGMDSMSTFLSKFVTSTNAGAVSAAASPSAPLGSYRINVTQLAANALLTTKENVVNSKDEAVTDTDAVFKYNYGGTERELDIPAGTTMQSFLNIINNDSRNLGVTASLIKSGDGYVFQFMGKDTGAGNSLEILANDLSKFDLIGWYEREAEDAEFYLEGRSSQILSSASNTLTEVIPGLTINLMDVTGDQTVTLTVGNDTAATKQRIVDFVDGVNELLAKFQELTKVDTNKEVKGSVLTGNYGVQLLNSKIKSAAVSMAKGFMPLEQNGTGDVFWSLATIGISMDADESSKTFGRLVIKEGESEAGSPFSTLDEALAHDPQAVLELLAADKVVRSNSPHFSYAGMLQKEMVTGGEHKVRVENVSGETRVWIDGVQAESDGKGEWTSLSADSKGLVIRLETIPANPGDWYEGTLSVKQGKINELNEIFKSELKGANLSVGGQTNEKGSLYVLRENYLDIIKNIEKKIEQEEARLILWETRMRMKFSRLDTLLSNYENQMASNEAALATASTNANYGGNKK